MQKAVHVHSFLVFSQTSDQILDRFFDLYHIGGRLKARDEISFTIDQEFREIPFDLVVVLEIRIHLRQHAAHEFAGLGVSKSLEFAYFFQPPVQRNGIISIDIDLGELRESDAETAGAESMDLFLGTRCLCSELVAWEIQDLETLFMISIIQFLQRLILRSETALRRCIDDENDFAFTVRKRNIAAIHGFDCEIIQVHMRTHYFA